MLSQALPDGIVESQNYMPERASRLQRSKSAYVRLLGNSANTWDSYKSQRDDPLKNLKHSNDFERPHSSLRRSSSISRNASDFQDEGETVHKYERARSRSRSRDERAYSPEDNHHHHIPSAHELVTNKNTTEKIKDLEKNNLHLKRMLQLVMNDPTRSIDRIKSAAPRLLVHRQNIKDPQGPPTLRHGRIGSSWRHIKQTNNYGNTNLLFIDGTVRINDSARYPPKVYGYPPRVANYDEDLIGLDRLEINGLHGPLTQSLRARSSRPSIVGLYSNQFIERARQGHKYWLQDERDPANNRRKAGTYSTGAHKTFFGLSDSIMKT